MNMKTGKIAHNERNIMDIREFIIDAAYAYIVHNVPEMDKHDREATREILNDLPHAIDWDKYTVKELKHLVIEVIAEYHEFKQDLFYTER